MLAAHDNARSPLRGDDRHVIPIAVNVDIDNLFSYQRPTIAASNHIDLSSENALKPFHHGNILLSSVWVSPHRILSGIATLGLLCHLRHFHYIITTASRQGGIRKRHALSFS